MNIEEAIGTLKEHKKLIDEKYLKAKNSKAIETVLNELEKKDTAIFEAINYMEETFELEDEKCITELYNILKKAEDK